MNTLQQQLQYAIDGRYPIIYCHTPEEDRVIQILSQVGQQLFGQERVATWACTVGLDDVDDAVATQSPVSAIQSISQRDAAGFYVMKDLSEFLDQTAVVRALRDAYYQLLNKSNVFLVIISPILVIPSLLEKNINLINVSPPGTDELSAVVDQVLLEHKQAELTAELRKDVIFSLKGLALNEARHTLHQVLATGDLNHQTMVEGIQASKKVAVNRASFLEYVPPMLDMSRIGGLDVLKEWIQKRTDIFNQVASDSGLPMPRGVLVMGISGCGKSLSAKVIAKMWGVPLFRLDMNQVFAGTYGTPEATFHKALQIAESVAPVVLWIDEIENGLGFSHQADNASQSQIISSFLTWMQEKQDDVFVAATANNIEVLPAEMIRKGRFDQVFFCDLPDDGERAEIFKIHIELNGGDLSQFDMKRLISVTQEWNAAEVEQLVVAARVEAFQEQRPITMQDLVILSRSMIPLSRTMSAQIKTIRDWAWNRATPASKDKGMSLPI